MVVGGDEFLGRFTFYLMEFKDVTFQITSHAKLSITYPEDIDHKPVLERIKPLLVKADGTPATIAGMIPKKDPESKATHTPRIRFEITQKISGSNKRRKLPNVGFSMFNEDDVPWRVRIEVRAILDGKNLGLIDDPKGYYDGNTEILLEAGEGFINGNFDVPEECAKSMEELTLEIQVSAIDGKNGIHKLFPKSWTYIREHNAWYYEPRAFT